MSSNKGTYSIAIFIGSILGGYFPTLFGAGFLSPWSIVSSAVFAFLALYLAYRVVG